MGEISATAEERACEEYGDHFAGFAEDLRGVVHVLQRAVRKDHGQSVANAVDAVVGQGVRSETDVLRLTEPGERTSSVRIVRSRISPFLRRKDIRASPPSKEISWTVHSSLLFRKADTSTPLRGF